MWPASAADMPFSQRPLEDLAGGPLRQSGYRLEERRYLVIGQQRPAVASEFIQRRLLSFLEDELLQQSSGDEGDFTGRLGQSIIPGPLNNISPTTRGSMSRPSGSTTRTPHP